MSSPVATLLHAVMDELGLARPSGYVGSGDIQVRQIVALLALTGDVLAGEHEWQCLVRKGSIATVNGVANYAVPSGFSGFVDETFWNTSNASPVGGARTQRDWAAVEGSGINIGPYFVQQMRDNEIYLQPTPTDAQTLTYYYLSGEWVNLVAGGTSTRPTSDADTLAWRDDRLLIAGTKYRWLRAKRLSYDEEYDEYARRLRSEIGVDRGARTLSLDPRGRALDSRMGFVVPLTGFGS